MPRAGYFAKNTGTAFADLTACGGCFAVRTRFFRDYFAISSEKNLIFAGFLLY